MPTYQQRIADAIAQFPATFGLRGFPGRVFRFSVTASYVSDGLVILYTQVQRDGEWADFAKATPAEIRRELVGT